MHRVHQRIGDRGAYAGASMIRVATVMDMEAIRALLTQLHARSPMHRFPVDWMQVERVLIMSMSKGSTFVDDDNGKLRGLIVALAMPLWWSPNVVVGQDMFFYSTRMRAGKLLLERAIDWCKAYGANWLQFGVSSFKTLDSVAALYLSAGLRREGSYFVKEV